MKRSIPILVVFVAMMSSSRPAGADSSVKVYEQAVVIPTYLIGPPDSTPRFYSGGTSQGAQHRIYPYPAYDNLTTEKVNKTYTMVYLENEYVKIGILPEIGGKVFEAIDKTNGYNFVYRQHVIKPALISLLGAWISGGMEWDVPHHHRATSFLPVQYTVEDNADQSKTVWVGELELRDRMRWAVGLTLHPGRSYLEAKFRMINRTPLPASMLCFSNVAVSVNDTYQVIFPPSTQHVTYHGKRDFTTWPIATTRFNNTDFTAGVDVSWYKNHHNSNSMFAWNYQDDFFAGYDHGRNAGTMAIADHNVVPGKKFFTWGNGPSGRAEDTLLTDSDGPYIELMVGAYSDNQPDYSWLEPFETRTWTQYWYPFRDIDGVKSADIDAAVNLNVSNGKATVGFYATAEHPNATVLLKLKDRVLLEEQAAIGPGKSYVKQIAIPAGADQHDLRASISADGRELVAYSPVKLVPEAMPKPVTNPPAPQDLKTNEELYLTGLRIEQFHAPGALPDPYWQEALKRDAGDVRVNTAMGIDAIKAGRFADAENYLGAALARATNRYTMPKDGEAFYYLGLALKDQGKNDEAFTQFYKSTWSSAWRSPGYFELAQIATCRGDFGTALGYLDRSLEADALNVRALALRSELLRGQDRKDESAVAAASLARIDPLDVAALKPTEIAANLAKFPNLGLEAAADDMDAGLWRQATDVLSLIDQSKIAALADYDLAYCAGKLNQPDKSAEYDRRAAAAPVDYAFPFQMEMIDVLQTAMNANPGDSHAPYYLGNLLYDWQPRRAVELWEQSASHGADFPVVFSNLALVYLRQDNARDKALAAVEKAVALGGNATVFNQIDQLYEENGVDPAKRLALMESHQPLIDRDDVIAREINLKIFAGKYDEAMEMLKSRFFRAWEGGGRFSLGDSWINANLLKGREQIKAGNFAEALADFQSALAVPANLQEATGNTASRVGEIQYWIGRAYEAMGQRDKAQQAWHAAVAASTAPSTFPAFAGPRFRAATGGLAAGVRVVGAAPFFQALALRGLGETDRANAIFQRLSASSSRISGATTTGSSAPPAQRAKIADAHYLAGLGQFGLGNKKSAVQEFNLAQSASPDHLAAKTMLTATGF